MSVGPTPEAQAKAAEAARRHAARGEREDRNVGKLLVGIAAVVVCFGAGLYLLTSESASEQATVFDSLMHGIGAYFIARGLWMIERMIR